MGKRRDVEAMRLKEEWKLTVAKRDEDARRNNQTLHEKIEKGIG